MSTELSGASFPALGTTAVVVVTEPDALPLARGVLERVLADVDAACSRFRPDSELMELLASPGRAVPVSPLLFEALDVALGAARFTDGLVDPTIGAAIRILGYDRDFATLDTDCLSLQVRVAPVPGWRAIRLDRSAGTVVVPRGVEVDLGATAKAWCADRAALAIAGATGVGVLVGLGGDLATAGVPPEDGWVVRIADRHDAPPAATDPVVTIMEGGLATSGTAARRWWRGDEMVHHIVDPATGSSASRCWRTASVAATSCLDANVASTAAIVLGRAAPQWLAARQLPARLVSEDGEVTSVAGWPVDEPEIAGERSV